MHTRSIRDIRTNIETGHNIISKNESSLGSIVILQFIATLKNTEGIIPEIILTKQAQLALDTLKNMIDTLSEDSELYIFIKNNYKLPISVVSQDIDGEINGNLKYSIPLKKTICRFFLLKYINDFKRKSVTSLLL